jgi:hypothetical protein
METTKANLQYLAKKLYEHKKDKNTFYKGRQGNNERKDLNNTDLLRDT